MRLLETHVLAPNIAIAGLDFFNVEELAGGQTSVSSWNLPRSGEPVSYKAETEEEGERVGSWA